MNEPQTGAQSWLPRLDGAAGPAEPIDAVRADALVSGAVTAWLAGAPSLPPPPPAPAPTSTTPVGWVAGGVGALALAGAAWLWLGGADPSEVDAPTPTPETAAVPRPVAPPVAVPPEPPAPEPGAGAVASETEGPDEGPDLTRRPVADDLLRRANALRSQGRYDAAARVYDRAARLGDGQLAGYVARVAAASLRLEHLGDPAGAARRYRAALASTPAGPLDLEIRRGLALAYRELGRTGDEVEALRSLLDHHPRGAAADEARARLDTLR